MTHTLLKLASRFNAALAKATPEEIDAAMPVLHAIDARLLGILSPDTTTPSAVSPQRTWETDLREDR